MFIMNLLLLKHNTDQAFKDIEVLAAGEGKFRVKKTVIG